ncbi:hypothetical protein [Ottowia thiooxydans]|uniref:hypothetical protein n=1 Tax=Ottowia thiooxydans TaxID=219182 RepID=UPI0005638ED6|nr:hypothetical protein [Ottowia thiooxydans]
MSIIPPEALARHPPEGDAANGLAKPAPRLHPHGLLRGLLILLPLAGGLAAYPLRTSSFYTHEVRDIPADVGLKRLVEPETLTLTPQPAAPSLSRLRERE